MRPINSNYLSDELLDRISKVLKLDLRKVVLDEFRLGIMHELDAMETRTTNALTHEKLAKAAMYAYETLMYSPNHYSNPPKNEIAHVLTGEQIPGDTDYARVMKGKGYGDHVQYENYPSLRETFFPKEYK